jgi:Flp pilus assembly protein TadG
MSTAANFIHRLLASRGGNAALIVALGMPALIGGAGLAVDTAQWYMWKRELQFAVD